MLPGGVMDNLKLNVNMKYYIELTPNYICNIVCVLPVCVSMFNAVCMVTCTLMKNE